MRKLDPLFDSAHQIRPHYFPDTVSSVLFGLALLFAGRRLFWLFVAGLGFITATEFVVPQVAPNDPAVALAVGLLAGLAGAVLAIFLQKVAVCLAGAAAGGYYAYLLASTGTLRDPATAWIALLIGAVLGAVVMLFLFKWALIVFSSIVGAHLLVRTFQQDLPPGITVAIFAVLAIVGIIFQGRSLRRAAA